MSGWQSSAQFLANQAAAAPIVAQKDETDAEWSSKWPQLECPSCGQLVTGLNDSQALVTGKLIWRFFPCNCECSAEAAGAYTQEIGRRKYNCIPFNALAQFKVPKSATKKLLELGEATGYEHMTKTVNPSQVVAKPKLDPAAGWPKSPFNPAAQLQTLPEGSPPPSSMVVYGDGTLIQVVVPAGSYQIGSKVLGVHGDEIGIILSLQPHSKLEGMSEVTVKLTAPQAFEASQPSCEAKLFKTAVPQVETAPKAHRRAVLASLKRHRRRISKPLDE